MAPSPADMHELQPRRPSGGDVQEGEAGKEKVSLTVVSHHPSLPREGTTRGPRVSLIYALHRWKPLSG